MDVHHCLSDDAISVVLRFPCFDKKITTKGFHGLNKFGNHWPYGLFTYWQSGSRVVWLLGPLESTIIRQQPKLPFQGSQNYHFLATADYNLFVWNDQCWPKIRSLLPECSTWIIAKNKQTRKAKGFDLLGSKQICCHLGTRSEMLQEIRSKPQPYKMQTYLELVKLNCPVLMYRTCSCAPLHLWFCRSSFLSLTNTIPHKTVQKV